MCKTQRKENLIKLGNTSEQHVPVPGCENHKEGVYNVVNTEFVFKIRSCNI